MAPLDAIGKVPERFQSEAILRFAQDDKWKYRGDNAI